MACIHMYKWLALFIDYSCLQNLVRARVLHILPYTSLHLCYRQLIDLRSDPFYVIRSQVGSDMIASSRSVHVDEATMI